MPLKAVTSQSLPDQVFRQIATAILDGSYATGQNLPAERQLAEVFGVNRHVVREATKRAEQVGLVSVTQGGGTKVLDFEKTAGLDALALLAEYAAEDEAGAKLWRAGFEMRAAIGTDVARLCALRADQKTKQELLAIATELKDATQGPEIVAIDLRFWELMIEGAGNIAYRLAYNSLIKSAQGQPEIQHHWTLSELNQSDYRMPIAKAIAEGDSAAAEAAARVSLRGAIDAVDAWLDQPAASREQNRA
jgi:DNA-binding FadR family transcriptional regulator